MTKRKNPFATDLPSLTEPVNIFGSRPERSQTKANKSKLTQTQKTKIKNAIGMCEYPGCNHPPHEVHHIKWLREGGTDTYSNLVVLCGSHHNDAHGKNPQGNMIPKAKLKNIVTKRSKIKADNIKAILKNVGIRGGGNRRDNQDPWDINFRI